MPPTPRENARKPFFSVGVTTFRRPELLRQCLRSILGQSFTDLEVLVGNDDPGEQLSAISLGFQDARLRIFNHEKNVGPQSNHNFLLHHSQGRYFAWLADDDMYSSDFLEAMHAALTQLEYPTQVYSSYSFGETHEFRPAGYEGKIKLLSGREFLRGFLSREFRVVGTCGVFEREYLIGIGGLAKLGDGLYAPYNDMLLAIQAGLLDKVGYIDSPLLFFRVHGGSFSEVSAEMDTYLSAQRDILRRTATLFRHPHLAEDSCGNLRQLLRIFISDYYAVAGRAERLQLGKLLAYHRWLVENSEGLGPNRGWVWLEEMWQCAKLAIRRLRRPSRMRPAEA